MVKIGSPPIPRCFICPITCELFQDPVILGTTGHTFEKKAITEWLKKKNCDPLTNERLTNITLTPNYAIREAVEEYLRTMAY